MIPKNLMNWMQFAVLVLTVAYLSYSILDTYQRRKREAAKQS